MQNNNAELENKLFKVIVLITEIISIISIIGNIVIGFPLYLNIKWICIVIMSEILIAFMKFDSIIKCLKLIYFLFVIIVVVPYGWIESGGSNNNTVGYIFIIMICITFFFHKKARNLLIILLMGVFASLLCLEYMYPQIIKMHTPKEQFLDRLFQIPLTLGGGYLLLKQFADAYRKEKQNHDIYSEKIKKANEKFKLMANRDELTGAYNRRKFDFEIKMIFEEKIYLLKEVYIILFDIDYFKKINDAHGHDVGDKIICDFVNIIEKVMPSSSIISRWGGDEFAIIFYGSINKLKNYLYLVYKEINNININKKEGITVSTGITLIKSDDVLQKVFKRVDNALYKSKKNGRNKYTVM